LRHSKEINKDSGKHDVLIFVESSFKAASYTWMLFDYFMFGNLSVGDGERIIKSYVLLKF
jgi:hypothetical protein